MWMSISKGNDFFWGGTCINDKKTFKYAWNNLDR